jgi:murein DD-endopeptidase MepM/ murein hydrolase activator NlpD
LLQATVIVRRAVRASRDQRWAQARLEDIARVLRRSIAAATTVRSRRAPSFTLRAAHAGAIGRRPAARPIRHRLPAFATHRPRLSDLAADRRGAPTLVLGLLLVATFVAAMPSATQGTGNTGLAEAAPVARISALAGDALDLDLDERAYEEASASRDLREPRIDDRLGAEPPAVPSGPFALDGTLIKPIAVDSSVPTVADQVRTYKVRSGDTLTGIGHRFGVSMMTIWWANHLTAKDELKIGQELVIPPTDGVLYTVKEGDSLASIAAAYQADPAQIIRFNEINGDVVVIGQQLMVPDGRGAPIEVAPAPPTKPTTSTRTTPRPNNSGTSNGCSGCSFGGSMRWPVAGGSISQYFHYGHYAIDIQAPYGTAVYAADDGKVIFSGWKSNGGGYQVWISHGGNVYTTYNHMSSLSVNSGAYVGRGQRIGRVGSTGYATGPHLHFEVWIGPIWNGGYRVNPLKYL